MKPLTREEVLKKAKQKESLKGANLRGVYLWGANLQEVDFSGADLRKAKLRGANLRKANLRGARLEDANLERANLKGADLEGAVLNNARFQGAMLEHANFKNTIMEGVHLENSKLCHAILSEANLANSNMEEADLNRADLRGADLKGSNLVRADMAHCVLKNANLEGANMEAANLESANLTGANLVWANIMIANMKDATLVDANLGEATLWGANLECANLEGAELRKADLDETNSKNANFTNANLQYANFNKCNLEGANLTGAKIYGASLRDIKTKGITVNKLDYSPRGDGTQVTDSANNLEDLVQSHPVEIRIHLKRIISEHHLIEFARFMIQAQKLGCMKMLLKSVENNGEKSVISLHLQSNESLLPIIFLLFRLFNFSKRKYLVSLYGQLLDSERLGIFRQGSLNKMPVTEFFAQVDKWDSPETDPEAMEFKKKDFQSMEIIIDFFRTIRFIYDAPHLRFCVNQESEENIPAFSTLGLDFQSVSG